MSPASIGIIGSGWRAEYFARIARALPERFSVLRVLTRSESSVLRVERDWAVPATTDLTAFLGAGPYDFVVVAVPREEVATLVGLLAAADIPVLLETPPAVDLPGLVALWQTVGGARVQVAEQYHLQPQHAARLALAASGAIGPVRRATISVAHEYHGISLLRFALGVGFAPVELRAATIEDRVLAARGRDGWFDRATVVDDIRTSATLDFGPGPDGVSRTGVGDFGGEQYVSPIRGRRIVIQGERGELDGDSVARVVDSSPNKAVPRVAREVLVRESSGADGDLDGYYLRGITLAGELLWQNRFAPARLNDDELAVADVMARMAEYGASGRPFYGLADASHDHYLSLLIAESARTGETVRSTAQPWSDQTSQTSQTSPRDSPFEETA